MTSMNDFTVGDRVRDRRAPERGGGTVTSLGGGHEKAHNPRTGAGGFEHPYAWVAWDDTEQAQRVDLWNLLHVDRSGDPT